MSDHTDPTLRAALAHAGRLAREASALRADADRLSRESSELLCHLAEVGHLTPPDHAAALLADLAGSVSRVAVASAGVREVLTLLAGKSGD